jgi:hypothetical protein
MPSQNSSKRRASRSLSHRMTAYALVAGTACLNVSALTSEHDASEGPIVFTPVHAFLGGLGTTFLPIDLNRDGVNDLTLAVYNFRTSVPSSAFAAARGSLWDVPAGGNAGAFHPLPKGAVIGVNGEFDAGKARLAWGDSVNHSGHGGYYTGGPWANSAADQYLGVHFLINGLTHYGWVRLTVVAYPYEVYTIVSGYAYNTVPNQPIKAGQGAFPGGSVVTVPATLGALSLGARGLELWRSTSTRREESQ